MGRREAGAEPGGGAGGARLSLPSWEGLAAAADSHLVRPLRLARPGPGVGCCPASWLSSPAPVSAPTSLRGTSDSGTATWQGSHVTGLLMLSELAEGKAAATGWGEGSDGEGKRSGTRQAPPCRIPPLATADPLTPTPPPPTTTTPTPKRRQPWRADTTK